jgi:hypothetical protein
MKLIKVKIEASDDFFWAYGENGSKIYAGGETIAEVKRSVFECIEIVQSFDDSNVPSALKGEYEIVWRFDLPSILGYYLNIFNSHGFARLIGIKEHTLLNYVLGLKKPRYAQVKKIESALHRLASDLLAIEL